MLSTDECRRLECDSADGFGGRLRASWSPDGRTIAFQRYPSYGWTYIYLITPMAAASDNLRGWGGNLVAG